MVAKFYIIFFYSHLISIKTVNLIFHITRVYSNLKRSL